VAPVFQIVAIGTQHRGLTGAERLRNSQRKAGDEDAGRTVTMSASTVKSFLTKVDFSYDTGKRFLRYRFQSQPGAITLVGPSGAGKSTIIGLIAAFTNRARRTFWWMAWTWPP
jgi:ABC-type multidrug transport system fused ATPase/permease subunit